MFESFGKSGVRLTFGLGLNAASCELGVGVCVGGVDDLDEDDDELGSIPLLAELIVRLAREAFLGLLSLVSVPPRIRLSI